MYMNAVAIAPTMSEDAIAATRRRLTREHRWHGRHAIGSVARECERVAAVMGGIVNYVAMVESDEEGDEDAQANDSNTCNHSLERR